MTDTAAVYNPFEPGFTDDPYPQYRMLRETDPVHHSPFGIWALFHHADVLRLLRDPELSVEDANANPTPLTQIVDDALAERPDTGGQAMLNRDPPDHTRLRRLVSKAFTPRMIESLAPRVAELVEQSLDEMAERGGGDVIGDLAFPLPFQVITELLGMPDADGNQLREWSGLLVRVLEPVVDPDLLRSIADAGAKMTELVLDAIEWKRRNPADDLLTALIAAEEQGEVLSADELAAQVMLLYIAGHETTVNLIGNGTLALLRHRPQFDRLAREPELAGGAVDELLRFDSPVQMSRRITLQELQVGDKTIEAGAFVVLVLASANRDRAQWGDDADELDIARADAKGHVSFGGGHHLCLGAALARLEGRLALEGLARRFPSLELAGTPVWNGRINLRGLDTLPVAVG
ncbi:MAG TPA: cytochrome P450 [Acidimicrobiales bacterium]|nr:cytochrome P450 [Acidimicrobiales bacterium]